ncbi:hypothetical protein F3Y22_tig00110383pilonHSYRG00151 [Hibiscus syriacus]|uniref:Uncharacterized protein n=1 Tax=Hibiscus syriacus TaxID=106335 RepID=A0A6A3ASA7_HIBSY|nr:hypothetical protein F3Y22_tig00110383pilonHSYRG00151 [Hibiscus syriacus]
MAAEVLSHPNGAVASNGDLNNYNPNPNPSAASKKYREGDRRRRRRKQKKKKKISKQENDVANGKISEADDSNAGGDETKESSDHQQVKDQVVVEYIPEKADLDDIIDEEFRKVFEKFSF